jgi:hypothetical protein
LSALFIVLTSPFPKNPASAIGHVLLVEADSSKPYPLWNTVGYMADIGDVGGFTYIRKGVFGGFPAQYEILPFYEKIEQYSDIENRDLWLYPLHISEEELKRFNDTLSAWAGREYPYRFFTINCVNGIYNILEKTLDSIPRAYSILTPQNFIELLYKSDRLGEPIHFHAGDSITEVQSKYVIPHKYSRLDLGVSFDNDFYFQLNFRPLLHSLKDRSIFYTPFMEFELLTLSVNFNRDSFRIKEFWYLKILSIYPQESISWMLNMGEIPKTIDVGIGQSYELTSLFYSGFLLRNSITRESKNVQNLSGIRMFLGSFSTEIWRYGMYGEYLYNFMDASHNFSINSWLCFDVSQNFSLLGEIRWKSQKESSIDFMALFYF